MLQTAIDDCGVNRDTARHVQSRPRKISTLLIGLGLLVSTCTPVLAGPGGHSATSKGGTTGIESLIDGIDSRYHAVRTLKADFTQTYVWGDTTRKETGIAYFE